MMRDLLRLLTVAVEQKLAHEIPHLVRRIMLRMVAALFGLAAFAVLLNMLWIALIPKVGPVGAPAIIAGVLAFIAAVCLALSYRRRHVVVVTASVPPHAAAHMAADAAGVFRDHKAAILTALFTAAFERGSRR